MGDRHKAKDLPTRVVAVPVAPASNPVPVESSDEAAPIESPEFAATWAFLVERDPLVREIAKWGAVATPTALDLAAREVGLAKARADLAAYDKRRGLRPGRGVPPRTRQDQIGEQIEYVCETLGPNPTARQVMRKLCSYANTAGTCVSGTRGDGVIWTDAQGGLHPLTMAALRKRLQRWRARR